MNPASPSQTSDLPPPTEHSAIKVSALPVLLQSALSKLLSTVGSLANLPLPLSLSTFPYPSLFLSPIPLSNTQLLLESPAVRSN